MRGQWLRLASVLVLGILGIIPDLLGLDAITPFAQGMAFRPIIVVLAIVVAVLLWIFAKSWRGASALLMVIALVGVCLIAPRVEGSKPYTASKKLTVLLVNVQTSQADPAEVAKVIKARKPDLIGIMEADRIYRERVQVELGFTDYDGQSAQSDLSPLSAVSVLWSTKLGEVTAKVERKSKFPSWIVTGPGLGNVTFVAHHGSPPTKISTETWHEDLAALRTWCGVPGNFIIAGSFNASLDHSLFRNAIAGCKDSAAELGEGLTSTFPQATPRWLGTQIEHIIYKGSVGAESVEFLDIPTSDHRGQLVTIGVRQPVNP
ncbi:endonuclease/exonuclease/phosphatase family protein [Pseudonocardiaceae bacterium YIM PH 21723]|nr:endonuclease/exonuclease/phosphatase family protein [Pseudonocardiaceae bacterium YIM PH 21723]